MIFVLIRLGSIHFYWMVHWNTTICNELQEKQVRNKTIFQQYSIILIETKIVLRKITPDIGPTSEAMLYANTIDAFKH